MTSVLLMCGEQEKLNGIYFQRVTMTRFALYFAFE